jgi:hypothetical protein
MTLLTPPFMVNPAPWKNLWRAGELLLGGDTAAATADKTKMNL